MKLWFLKNPPLLNQVKNLIAKNYPDLRVCTFADKVTLRGSFPVYVNSTVVDRFNVEIELPGNYPEGVPLVWEIGGRIPRVSDRHIIEKTGIACLFLREERWKYYPLGSTVLDFLKGPVNDYFLWQTEFELTGQPKLKARPHGIDGIVEFYKEELQTEDIKAIRNCIDYLRRDTKGHWPCYCNSGKNLSGCHFDKFMELKKKIPLKVAEQFFADLSEAKFRSTAQEN